MRYIENIRIWYHCFLNWTIKSDWLQNVLLPGKKDNSERSSSRKILLFTAFLIFSWSFCFFSFFSSFFFSFFFSSFFSFLFFKFHAPHEEIKCRPIDSPYEFNSGYQQLGISCVAFERISGFSWVFWFCGVLNRAIGMGGTFLSKIQSKNPKYLLYACGTVDYFILSIVKIFINSKISSKNSSTFWYVFYKTIVPFISSDVDN